MAIYFLIFIALIILVFLGILLFTLKSIIFNIKTLPKILPLKKRILELENDKKKLNDIILKCININNEHLKKVNLIVSNLNNNIRKCVETNNKHILVSDHSTNSLDNKLSILLSNLNIDFYPEKSSLKFLLISDDLNHSQFIKTYLLSNKFNVYSVDNFTDAKNIINLKNFDFIISKSHIKNFSFNLFYNECLQLNYLNCINDNSCFFVFNDADKKVSINNNVFCINKPFSLDLILSRVNKVYNG